jgi:hypothetical protein
MRLAPAHLSGQGDPRCDVLFHAKRQNQQIKASASALPEMRTASLE